MIDGFRPCDALETRPHTFEVRTAAAWPDFDEIWRQRHWQREDRAIRLGRMVSAASSPLVPWYDRRFDFTFCADLMPNIAARLRGTPARLEDLLQSCEKNALTTRVGGRWSIQENVGHLLDVEPLWIARVCDFAAGSSQLTPPRPRTPQVDGTPLASLLRDFRQKRFQLLRAVEEIGGAALMTSILHPRLQVPIRLADHLYFVAEHDDHHLAWIWRLVQSA